MVNYLINFGNFVTVKGERFPVVCMDEPLRQLIVEIKVLIPALSAWAVIGCNVYFGEVPKNNDSQATLNISWLFIAVKKLSSRQG